MERISRENIVRATASLSSTTLTHHLRKVAEMAAVLRDKGGGFTIPLDEIEDDELFAWALGYWSVLCQAAAAYERGTWFTPAGPEAKAETARPDSDPADGSRS